MRHLLIFLIPFMLVACHPKEAAVTKAQKAALVKEERIAAASASLCPPFAKLSDGQCLCNKQALGLSDAATWLCVDDAWMCFSVGGCRHSRGICGFGGELLGDDCACVDRISDEKMLGDYLCRNAYWVCDKEAGCGQGSDTCDYGETCFDPVSECFGVELKEDLANYRCEDKLWTCRHTEGCACRGELVPFGSHCIGGEVFCGDTTKPKEGQYKCVGACTPERTQSIYRWLCEDEAGCPCGGLTCGYGASCDGTKCTCGEATAPEASEQYRCYLEHSVGIAQDEIESLVYWICNREAGCKCGDTQCAMGESCFPEGQCKMQEANRPRYYQEFSLELGEWTCRKPEGCRCDQALCGNGQFCDQGQCSCDGDRDCTQSVCSDGRCREALSCGSVEDPGHPGYLCENEAWICRDEGGCFCGNGLCSLGAACRQGQCFCDSPDAASPKHIESYACEGKQWVCDDKNGCICGLKAAPHGSICRAGEVYCGDTPVKDGQGYACKMIDGRGELLCLAASAGVCACGEGFCASGTLCINGECRCGDTVTPNAIHTDGYICNFGNYVCGLPPCKCGENGCGAGGRCENDLCVCGPNATVAPKDASAYACAHYDGNERHHVEEWICQGDTACRCGDTFCGSGGVCEGDKACRCGEQLAPMLRPDTYVCDRFYGTWACNDKQGCPLSDGVCPYLYLIDKHTCVKPSDIGEDAPGRKDFQSKDDDCLGDKRPPEGSYVCIDQTGTGSGDAQRSGWACTGEDGCPCGDDMNADICRSKCIRYDKKGHCLEEAWFAQYLPICDGPRGIGSDSTCVDACANLCNGFYQPESPGYACDNRAWICGDDVCNCRSSACPKGHYCVGGKYCTL